MALSDYGVDRLLQQAREAFSAGATKSMLSVFDEWLALAPITSTSDQYRVLNVYGICLNDCGRWSLAEMALTRSFELADAEADFDARSCALANLVSTRMLRGELSSVLQLTEDLSKEGTEGRLVMLANRASAAASLGEAIEAERAAREGLGLVCHCLRPDPVAESVLRNALIRSLTRQARTHEAKRQLAMFASGRGPRAEYQASLAAATVAIAERDFATSSAQIDRVDHSKAPLGVRIDAQSIRVTAASAKGDFAEFVSALDKLAKTVLSKRVKVLTDAATLSEVAAPALIELCRRGTVELTSDDRDRVLRIVEAALPAGERQTAAVASEVASALCRTLGFGDRFIADVVRGMRMSSLGRFWLDSKQSASHAVNVAYASREIENATCLLNALGYSEADTEFQLVRSQYEIADATGPLKLPSKHLPPACQIAMVARMWAAQLQRVVLPGPFDILKVASSVGKQVSGEYLHAFLALTHKLILENDQKLRKGA